MNKSTEQIRLENSISNYRKLLDAYEDFQSQTIPEEDRTVLIDGEAEHFWWGKDFGMCYFFSTEEHDSPELHFLTPYIPKFAWWFRPHDIESRIALLKAAVKIAQLSLYELWFSGNFYRGPAYESTYVTKAGFCNPSQWINDGYGEVSIKEQIPELYAQKPHHYYQPTAPYIPDGYWWKPTNTKRRLKAIADAKELVRKNFTNYLNNK